MRLISIYMFEPQSVLQARAMVMHYNGRLSVLTYQHPVGLLWDTCPGAGVVAATGEWSVGCEGDNHLCKVWKVYQCLFSYQETLT